MKKLFLLLLVFVTITAAAQTKNDTTAKLARPADSVAFVSANNFSDFLKWLPENVTVSEYLKLKPEEVLIKFYTWAVDEWNKKKKKP
jgi:hypothetical protein